MMHRIFFAFIWIIGRVLLWIYRVDVKGLKIFRSTVSCCARTIQRT